MEICLCEEVINKKNIDNFALSTGVGNTTWINSSFLACESIAYAVLA